MWILKRKKLFFSISAALVALSVAAIGFFGLNAGIDFAGGSLLEIQYTEQKPQLETVRQAVIDQGGVFATAVVQGTDSGLIIKTADISDEQKLQLGQVLSDGEVYPYSEVRFKSIGPSISDELKSKSLFAIGLVVIVIILFVWYVFSGVSYPVSSFRYGLVAVVALVHDIIIPTGIFAILGTFLVDYQIDVLFITALLAILGFSVNDTIVVFDRVRENLRRAKEASPDKKSPTGADFEAVVGASLEQTFVRSLHTSITTLIVLAFLFVIGGESTQPFALVLALGVIGGTYSSLFLASPLLVLIEQKQAPRHEPDPAEEAEMIAPGSPNYPG